MIKKVISIVLIGFFLHSYSSPVNFLRNISALRNVNRFIMQQSRSSSIYTPAYHYRELIAKFPAEFSNHPDFLRAVELHKNNSIRNVAVELEGFQKTGQINFAPAILKEATINFLKENNYPLPCKGNVYLGPQEDDPAYIYYPEYTLSTQSSPFNWKRKFAFYDYYLFVEQTLGQKFTQAFMDPQGTTLFSFDVHPYCLEAKVGNHIVQNMYYAMLSHESKHAIEILYHQQIPGQDITVLQSEREANDNIKKLTHRSAYILYLTLFKLQEVCKNWPQEIVRNENDSNLIYRFNNYTFFEECFNKRKSNRAKVEYSRNNFHPFVNDELMRFRTLLTDKSSLSNEVILKIQDKQSGKVIRQYKLFEKDGWNLVL